MLTRTREKTWAFRKPFTLKGIDRELPAGSYRVATDEELIEGLSFPVYRRVATMIFIPAQSATRRDRNGNDRSRGSSDCVEARCFGNWRNRDR